MVCCQSFTSAVLFLQHPCLSSLKAPRICLYACFLRAAVDSSGRFSVPVLQACRKPKDRSQMPDGLSRPALPAFSLLAGITVPTEIVVLEHRYESPKTEGEYA